MDEGYGIPIGNPLPHEFAEGGIPRVFYPTPQQAYAGGALKLVRLSSLELLRKISSTLHTFCDSRSLFQTIVKELALNLALDGCIVLAIDKQRQNAIVQAHYNRYPWSQESCGDQLTLERYPALVEAVRTATIKEVHSLPSYTGAQGQSSLDRVVDMCCSLILPLVSTGKVIGLLVCQNVHPQIRFTKKETLLLETATELITNALLGALAPVAIEHFEDQIMRPGRLVAYGKQLLEVSCSGCGLPRTGAEYLIAPG